MLKFLLPKQLVAQAPTEPGASMYAGALGEAFSAAYPLIRSAAWGSIPISLFGLLPSIFLLQVYDRVIYRSGTSTLYVLVCGILTFLVIEFWLRTRRSRLLRDAGAAIDHRVSGALLESMLHRPLRALEARPASAWFLFFRDVGSVRGTVTGGLATSIFDLPMAIFALVVIGVVALPVLPVVVAFLCIISFLAWWWADEVRAGRVEEIQRGRSLERMTSEICQARETLKTQANDAPTIQMWRETYNAWLAESFRKNGEIETARDGTTVLLTIFSVLVITVGAIAVMQQWMTVGGLVASNMLAIKALQPVAGLASNWRALATASEAAARLEKVLSEPIEKSPGDVDLPQPQGRIQLRDVAFSFTEGARPVMEKINLDIGPGGLHVIVGRNGAGKSTLVKLIAGLYAPTRGTVSIGEYDVSQFSREELVRWISYLSQEVYWFGGPLVETLRRAAPGQTDDQILAACRLAGAHDFISRMPNGYRTEIGEGGTGLSVGERRKLALALSFLRKPSVLMLDEPSNDLDFQSERTLLATLIAVARVRTVIVVTHSLRIVSSATQVYHVTGDGDVLQGSAADMVPRLFGVKKAVPVAAGDDMAAVPVPSSIA
ncbi:peptidase domain-containing ABC transporter [Variovorax ginsengisoli]|uniref:ATP-binding cassette subfamily C protein LapB n=1 Tax=Variovorax ginsengisoli TaxID=363844 RepID=A0ABT9SG52_9BURK|nr:ATP-binding cassette domain-containing protein [Variovorax ginsengisoli]MDP9902347.1 ATP-binding cassette subfamily C protein LapB [Variovorax ginsengisoli]